MLETPRSSRIASAWTPLSASCARTSENSPRSSRVWIPDLEVVVDSGDDDVPAELRMLDERARQHQPALLVELRLRRAREEEPVEPAPLLAERIQRGELRLDESIPIRTTVGVEAPV